MLFCGIRPPLRATANTSSTLGSRRRNATSAVRAVDGGHRLVDPWRVGDAVQPVPVDELRVEAILAAHDLDAAGPVCDRGRPVVGLGGEHVQRLGQVRDGFALVKDGEIGAAREHAVSRERAHSRIVLGYDESHDPYRFATLASEIDRCLVPVVPVGDEQLAGEIARRVDPPKARPIDLDVGRSRRRGDGPRSVRQHEDRLGLHAGRAEQVESVVPDACVRPLVRQDHPDPYGSAGIETSAPRRSRETPSGPTYRSTLTHVDGSSSCSRTPAASHSR